jgi:hypothetical protein
MQSNMTGRCFPHFPFASLCVPLREAMVNALPPRMKLLMDRLEPAPLHMRINLRRRNIRMS